MDGNSLNRSFSDKVFVHREGTTIDGMVTCRVTGPGTGTIGLIAAGETAQGRGIGRDLLIAVEQYYRTREVASSLVVTQRSNRQACRFYEKNGFVEFKTEYVYHWWLK